MASICQCLCSCEDKMKYLAVLVAVILSSTAAYRLPRSVVPSHYHVNLNLTADVFTANSDQYDGYVIITFITAETNVGQIQLHAAHDFIDISLARINNVTVTNVTVDNTTDIVTLSGFQPLQANISNTLYISFTSRLSTQDMYGFYKSSYTSNGTTKYLATTQFQPVYARRAFPCFDEPTFKANFTINITYPQELNALSNMPGEFHNTSNVIGNDPNLTTTLFYTTGRMPTYLIAFIVSDFSCSNGENIEENLVPYRICSTEETNSTRAFALQTGVSLLRSLNTFTNYNYSTMGFPKMDQVAIPDFAAGAMENWGLVTYRERLLLWDPLESTNGDQQNIAKIISHEFAHQWFGNLVTMEWWSETFLNEGFATYFEYFTTHDVFPSWQLDKQWVVRVLQTVLETDSSGSAQALQAPANSDAEVMARFSQISYFKGGAILKMVEHILGTELFIEGLRVYLQTYAFQNTLPEDLWNTLDAQLSEAERAVRLPPNTTLNETMTSWIQEPGYPLINVQPVQTAVIISQEGRFLLNANNTSARWYVPISYATNLNNSFNATAPQEWLSPLGFVEVPFLTEQWIVLNKQVAGYYRVNYNGLWNNIIVALRDSNFSGIPEENRAAFVDDAFHLARAKKINYTRAFGIIDFLKNDTSHHSWFPAIRGFNFLLRRVGQESGLGRAISDHVLDLLGNIYGSVPWIDLRPNDHAYTLKQNDILALACRLGLPNCVNYALERFGEFRIAGIRPARNLRAIVYCNGLRYGNNRADWNLLWNLYNVTGSASEKVRILSALGCIQDEATLEYYLQLSLNENSGIRPQDALSVFTAVYSGSSIGIQVAFRFLQQNHQLINDRYQSMNALSNIITGLAGTFTNQSQVNELRQFIETGGLHEDFQTAAAAALATAESNLLWLEEYWEELHQIYGLNPNDSLPITGVPTQSTMSQSTTSQPTTPLSTTTPTRPNTSIPSEASAITITVCLLIGSLMVTLKM